MRAEPTRIASAPASSAAAVVPDRQLSLAIGREGQNARLAAKLTGWNVDIRSNVEPEAAVAEKPAAEIEAAVEAPAAGEEVETAVDAVLVEAEAVVAGNHKSGLRLAGPT